MARAAPTRNRMVQMAFISSSRLCKWNSKINLDIAETLLFGAKSALWERPSYANFPHFYAHTNLLT